MAKDIENNVPSNKVREIRENEDLSQAQLAVLAGRTAETISEIENSKRRPSRRTRKQILRALNENPTKRDKNQKYKMEDVFPGTQEVTNPSSE